MPFTFTASSVAGLRWGFPSERPQAPRPPDPSQPFPAAPHRETLTCHRPLVTQSARGGTSCSPLLKRPHIHSALQLLSAPARGVSRHVTSRRKGYFKRLPNKTQTPAENHRSCSRLSLFPPLPPAVSVLPIHSKVVKAAFLSVTASHITPAPGEPSGQWEGAGCRSQNGGGHAGPTGGRCQAPASDQARHTVWGPAPPPPAALPVRPVPPILSPLHRPPLGGERGAWGRGSGLPSRRAAPRPRPHTEQLASSTLLPPSEGRGRPPGPASPARRRAAGRAARCPRGQAAVRRPLLCRGAAAPARPPPPDGGPLREASEGSGGGGASAVKWMLI